MIGGFAALIGYIVLGILLLAVAIPCLLFALSLLMFLAVAITTGIRNVLHDRLVVHGDAT